MAQHSAELLEKCSHFLELNDELYIQLSRSDLNISTIQKEGYIIDHRSKGNAWYLYLTPENFTSFLDLQVGFNLVEDYYQGAKIKMYDLHQILGPDESDCISTSWDFYPTYEAYEGIMMQLADEYPSLCTFHQLGTLSSGRRILALQLGNNLDATTGRPKSFYTSTMHGDETAGFVLLLRLADYLLCNYGVEENITQLLDDSEIWINPLANPDGTYRMDNSTVTNAKRTNSNGVDLNRNFPDPLDGISPDGNPEQQETLIFKALAESEKFNLSMNVHGGIELFNYPWDTWSTRPADDDWWICMGRQYCDTVHAYAPPTYMDEFDNGVVNGWDWFEADGSRQDFVSYFHNGREFTLEISNQKVLDSDQLPIHWEYNYRSFINFLEEGTKGVQGSVRDSETLEPIEGVEVFTENHDFDNSQVFTNSKGFYARYLNTGPYSLRFSAEDYVSQTIDVNVVKGEKLELNVELVPRSVSTNELEKDRFEVLVYEQSFAVQFSSVSNRVVSVYSLGGALINSAQTNATSLVLERPQIPGVYLVQVEEANGASTKKVFF